MSNNTLPGKLTKRSISGMQALEYLIYEPKEPKESRVMVSVHGISRNAEEHILGFIPQAEQYGTTILAPHFPKNIFPRYQRLGNSAQENRADLAFDSMMQDAMEFLGYSPYPLHMFGFSGGGQFAHRYGMFYPKKVARLVLSAPGWYTFPDPNQYYPFGLRASKEWPNLKFAAESFLGIPVLVLVGEEDDVRDKDLNALRRIDAFQGFNRIERGMRWVTSMRALATAFGIHPDFHFETVPNASHAYSSYLAHLPFGERIFLFLFDPKD